MMLLQKWGFATGAIALLISPALFGFSGIPSAPQTASRAERLISLRFPGSPGGNGPSRTASGGSRSIECFVEHGERITPITVLMPLDNIGTTVAPEPNLFLYIPKSQIDGGQVVINDETSNTLVYDKEFNLSNKPGNSSGIVKLVLKGANLEPNKTYSWSFMPFCYGDGGMAETIGIEVKGNFQRTSLSTDDSERLQQANTPLQRAEIYAGAKVWNETLTLALETSKTAPQEWRALLESVQLNDLAQAPYFGESPVFSEEKMGAEAPGMDSMRSPDSPNTMDSSTPIEGLW